VRSTEGMNHEGFGLGQRLRGCGDDGAISADDATE
jgi:hypothetical protein